MERKRFYQYLWSAILTSLSGTLCVQIDGIIVSHLLGEHAFAAIGVLMPLVQVLFTLCLLVGIGGALRLSYAVGADDRAKEKQIFRLTACMLLLCSIPFVVLGFWSTVVAGWFCQSDGLMPLAADYGRVLLFSAPVYLLLQGCGAMVRAEGFPKRILWAMVLANVLNLSMDVLFIAGFHWGIAGAGWATTISNLIALIIILMRGKGEIERERESERENHSLPTAVLIKDILIAGAPMALSSVATFCRLSYLTSTTSRLLGAEGMVILAFVMSIFLLVNLIVAGTTQALQPLAGQYIGHGDMPALYRTCRRALLFTLVSSLIITLLIIVMAPVFCSLYGVADNRAAAVPALRIFALSAVFSSLGYVMMVIHQVMGNKAKALFLAVLQPLLLIPVFYLFTIPALPLGIAHVWWAFLLSETLNLIIVLILSHNVLKSVFTTQTGC